MKIKRFEAQSMSEALRMIKKEFGEEAVILSAKNNRKGGRLFAGKSAKVVVTAAIDRNAVAGAENEKIEETSPMTDEFEPKTPAQGRGVSEHLGRLLEGYTPITRTGMQKLQPKLVNIVSRVQSHHHDEHDTSASQLADLQQSLTEQGLNQSLAAELANRMVDLAGDDTLDDKEKVSVLSQIITAKNWVAPIKPLARSLQRIVVMVGPCGAGKTSAVAKLAAHALIGGQHDMAVISLDDQRVAGTTELERYAQIMSFPFEAVTRRQQFSKAMERFSDCGLILIDTPGIGQEELERMERVGQMLDMLENPEVHLLVNAAIREQVMARTIEFFLPLGVNRLMPTHLDWAERLGPFVNQLTKFRMPVSYLSTGTQVPEGIRLAAAGEMAAMLLSIDGNAHRGEGFEEAITVVKRRPNDSATGRYVANSNSDIFHHLTCKSASRISRGNAVNFKDPGEAMDQGFKPCRMCCMDLLTPKPIDRLARTRYAGTRN